MSIKYNNLKSFLGRIKPKSTSLFDVISTEDIVTLSFDSDKYASYNRKYRIGISSIPNSNVRELLLIDKDCVRLKPGINEYLLKKTRKVPSKMQNYKSWDDIYKKFKMAFDVQPVYDINKILTGMRRKGIAFRTLLNYLLSDVSGKDVRIVDLVKATCFPVPMSIRDEFQPYNCHAIALTNTGAAKTTTFSRYMGREPVTDLSEPGLLGGYDKSVNAVRDGSLKGSGVLVIDEFPDSDKQIMDKMLNYMVSGRTQRDIMPPILCNGTKSVVFLGNCEETSLSGRSLGKYINSVTKSNNFGRVGRRIALLYYNNDFVRVTPSRYSSSSVSKARSIVSGVIEMYGEDAFKSMFKYSGRWLNQSDSEYEDDVSKIAELTNNGLVREFLYGHKLAVPNIKMAALKLAVFDYMDILSKDREKESLCEVLTYAKWQYEQFKKYNIGSFGFVKAPIVERVRELDDEGKNWKEVTKELGISPRTYYKYKGKHV